MINREKETEAGREQWFSIEELVGLAGRVWSRTLTKSFGTSSSHMKPPGVSARAALTREGRIPPLQG